MPEPEPEKKPDAVMIPVAWGAGLSDEDYAEAVCVYAEGVLGGDRKAGRRVYARAPMPGDRSGMLFCTLNFNDTMLHEYGHARELNPRYDWTDQPDGSRVGRLTADATPTRPMTRESSPTPTNPIAKLVADKRREEAARARANA